MVHFSKTCRLPKYRGRIKVERGHENLTSFGGAVILEAFLEKINLKRLIMENLALHIPKTKYTAASFILPMAYSIALGIERLSNLDILQRDSAFRCISHLRDFPDTTSLWRCLYRFDKSDIDNLSKIRTILLNTTNELLPITRATVDLDSTVLTTYGHQEGAEVGYNPHKPGRPSYHPLFAFVGETRHCIKGILRKGSTYTGFQARSFFSQCLELLPDTIKKINIRADSGFYDGDLIELAVNNKNKFAIVAKVTKPIQRITAALKFRSFLKNYQESEFEYQPIGWSRKYRFIVVRKWVKPPYSSQMTFIPPEKWEYQVIVTNLSMLPRNVWRFYNKRANVENIVKELKLHFNMSKIPASSFLANEAYFQIILLTYDIITLLRRLCLPKKCSSFSVTSIRKDFLRVPAKLSVHGGKACLSLSNSYHRHDDFMETLNNIHALKLQNLSLRKN